MTSYYADVQWRAFMAMYRDGRRNLQDPSALSEYYDGVPDVASEEVAARFAASSAYRLKNELPGIPSGDFAAQLSERSSQDTFLRLVSEMGIEVEYVEDISVEEPDQAIPSVAGIAGTVETLIRRGHTIDMAALAARFPVPERDATVLHLAEDPPSAWAEEDATLRMKRRRAEDYVQQYVGGQ